MIDKIKYALKLLKRFRLFYITDDDSVCSDDIQYMIDRSAISSGSIETNSSEETEIVDRNESIMDPHLV